MNLRQAGSYDSASDTGATVETTPDFSSPQFRVATMDSIVGNMGESLDPYESSEETRAESDKQSTEATAGAGRSGESDSEVS